jgi:hypothetical protein
MGVLVLSLLPCSAYAATSVVNGTMGNLSYSGTGIVPLTDAQWPAHLDWAPSFSDAAAETGPFFPIAFDEDTDDAGTLQPTAAFASVGLAATGTAATAPGIWGVSASAAAASPAFGYSYAYAEAWQDLAIYVPTAQTVTIEADYALSYSLTAGTGQEAYAYVEAGLLIWDAQDNDDPLAEGYDLLEDWVFDNDFAADAITGAFSLDVDLDPGTYVLDMWVYSAEAGTASVPAPSALLLCALGTIIVRPLRRK